MHDDPRHTDSATCTHDIERLLSESLAAVERTHYYLIAKGYLHLVGDHFRWRMDILDKIYRVRMPLTLTYP